MKKDMQVLFRHLNSKREVTYFLSIIPRKGEICVLWADEEEYPEFVVTEVCHDYAQNTIVIDVFRATPRS